MSPRVPYAPPENPDDVIESFDDLPGDQELDFNPTGRVEEEPYDYLEDSDYSYGEEDDDYEDDEFEDSFLEY